MLNRTSVAVSVAMLALGITPMNAQDAAPPPTAVANAGGPFQAPEEMKAYMRRLTRHQASVRGSLQQILTMSFQAADQGGLGIVYDNTRTRSVEEVWRERKANCLSLTAFYVEACAAVGIQARHAEALNTQRWCRRNGQVRLERHVVALVEGGAMGDLVADFLPQARRRTGTYEVNLLSPARFLALYHANQAVESMEAGDLDAAELRCRQALEADPKLGAAWNTRGVLRLRQGQVVEAEADFRRALALEKRDHVALGNLEQLFRDQGREAEAAAFREQSLKLRMRDPYFRAFLGDEAMQAGNLDEAMKHVRAALRIHAGESEFHLLKARIELERGDLEAAGRTLKEAQKVADPEEQRRLANKSDALNRLREEGKRAPEKP